jgi:hypothetical protein
LLLLGCGGVGVGGEEVHGDHEVALAGVGGGAREGERDGDVVGLALDEAGEGGEAEGVVADAARVSCHVSHAGVVIFLVQGYAPVLQMHRDRRLQGRDHLVVENYITDDGRDAEQEAGAGDQKQGGHGLLHPAGGDGVEDEVNDVADDRAPPVFDSLDGCPDALCGLGEGFELFGLLATGARKRVWRNRKLGLVGGIGDGPLLLAVLTMSIVDERRLQVGDGRVG